MPHHGSVSSTVASARGASRGVVVAAVAVAVGALPALLGFAESRIPAAALYGAGWPAFGLVAALLLDRGTNHRLGRVLTALALVPTVVVAISASGGERPVWPRVEDLWQRVDLLLVLGALVAIATAMGYAPDRNSRRRLCWLLVWSGVVVAAVSLTRSMSGPGTTALVITLGLWGIAGLVVRLALAADLRPLDEPVVDVVAAVFTVAIGAGAGLLVRVAADRAEVPRPDVFAAFAAVIATALAWPAATWARRWWLERRYGAGTLTPGDVAAITADLQQMTDPRVLLDKAADMVAASSGHRRVELVLGADSPACSPDWAARPLVIGGEPVGTLLLKPDDSEGPEPLQARIVDQLLPTVALVCRAVGLAVEAEDARQGLARERDSERARILGDLHDGLGPVLAGMSMRVQAELRERPTRLLRALATDLASSRGDLRRLVSGLTPSALHDADLAGALNRLVATFEGDGRRVSLELALDEQMHTDVAVAVYRSVAEGITNALRHGRATHVAVRVSTAGTRVCVEVHDDGVGGPIAPGVGLTSLRRRVEQLGGSLVVGPGPGTGVLLHLELPATGAA
jgi:signal transduction histidine kinase